LRRYIGGLFFGGLKDEGECQSHGWLWRGGLAVGDGGDSVWRTADDTTGDSDGGLGGLVGGKGNAGKGAFGIVAFSAGNFCRQSAHLHFKPAP